MNIATTKHRILQYIDFKGFSVAKFFKDTGIKRGFLDTDKLNSSVSDLFIAKIIATYSDLNIFWLVTGKSEMILGNYDIKNTISEVSEPEVDYEKNKSKDVEISALKAQVKILQETVIMGASIRLCPSCNKPIN